VTDYDVWAEKPVSADEIITVIRANVDKAKRLFGKVIPMIPEKSGCDCGNALANAIL
jgi:5'-methylthioadenosine phosphorylase